MSEGGGLYNYKGQLAEKPKPDSVSQGVRGGGEGGTKYCPVLDPAAECVFCHCWVRNNLLLGYTKPATMLHKASCWARLPPISTAVLHMITSHWTLSLKWHMAAELRSVFGWHDNFFSLITTRLEHPNGAIILILKILLVVSWVSHHSSIFLGTPFA